MKIWNAPKLEELDVNMTMGGTTVGTDEAEVAALYRDGTYTKLGLEVNWRAAREDGTPYPVS